VSRRPRVIFFAGGAAALGAAVVGVALLARSGPSHLRPRAAPSTATTTTTRRAPATTTTAWRPTTMAPVATPRLVSHPAPPAATPRPSPTTTQPPAPWPPPGTLTDVKYLSGSMVFTPSTFVSGSAFSYTATLTNTTDDWLYIPLEDVSWHGFWIYLHSEYTDEEYDIPSGLAGVDATAPEFQHETPAGHRNGLLLPPNGSYSFSRSFRAGRPDPNLFADTLMHADIQFVEPGVPDPRLSKIARNSGSFTVLLPPASTTTTEVPSA
jgi:hypothetical protein